MPQSGPLLSDDGLPLNYLVVIDAGSTGLRVYVYSYLDPVVLQKVPKAPKLPKLPQLHYNKKWHHKLKPGLSSYADSPEDIHSHLAPLVEKAKKWIPDTQHSRTPILLHATAGMRLVSSDKQGPVMSAACEYLQQHLGFWLPSCEDHVNIVDADIEGVYAWLAINHAKGAFDNPDDHQHGDGHTTYGVLDMGGALTQIVFQPNSTETDHHRQDLFKLDLVNQDSTPRNYDLYAHLFLGFGMYQALDKYEQLMDSNPCYPKGKGGLSNFTMCLNLLDAVVQTQCPSTTTNSTGCLLSDPKVPTLDFAVNHFVGVLGYWDAIEGIIDQDSDDEGEYNYENVYNATRKVCDLLWKQLKKLDLDIKHDDDLAMACFKLAWVLAFLHRGLGFPRFGLDTPLKDDQNFRQLEVVEELGEFKFSWTLGRALLYASDEYAAAKGEVRAGYVTANGTLVYGLEQTEHNMRPRFELSRWDSPTHRYTGLLVLVLMFLTLLYVMVGRERRQRAVQWVKAKFGRKHGYVRVGSTDDLELLQFTVEDSPPA